LGAAEESLSWSQPAQRARFHFGSSDDFDRRPASQDTQLASAVNIVDSETPGVTHKI
jgi:hypothetical protein